MRNKLPYLACLPGIVCAWAFAQAPVEKTSKPAGKPAGIQAEKAKPADQPSGKAGDKPAQGGLKLGVSSDAEKKLEEAIAKIEALLQFRCDVRQVTEMLGYRFTADGQYAVAPDYRMLYELKVQLTDTTGTIKEVCDGRFHWQNQKIFDEQQLTKLDVKKIREVLEKPQFNKDLRDSLTRRMGFSGMVPLMKGLRDSQKFETFEEDDLNGTPVYVLHGQWNETVISQTSFRGQQLSITNLPPYMPNKSTVWIGRDDGWLYRVEMESTQKIQGSATKFTLEFLNPQIGVELPESLFVFEPPPGVKAQDQTESMYQNLTLILQQSQTKATSPSSSSGSQPGSDKSKSKPAPTSEPATKPGLGLQP